MTLQSGPDQECRVERFKTVCGWRRTEEPLRIDERRDYGATVIAKIDNPKAGTIGEEVKYDAVVFFGLARAGRVHEASTRAHDVGGAHQPRELSACKPGQVVLMSAPPDIGVPAHGSEPRAGRVDENRVECCVKRQ